ncbi:hypothetical protein D3C74_30480 [compost metagenome]
MEMIKLNGSINPIDGTESKGLMTTIIKVKDLLSIFHIDPTINRDINASRLPKLINYIDQYEEFPGVFFPSITCAYSGETIEYVDNVLTIIPNHQLIVIDGQHRIKSLESYINNPRIIFSRREKVLNSDLTLQLYFGLSKDDMKQLFVDINSNAVKVSMSLITSFDSREIMNILVRELYGLSQPLQTLGIEFNKTTISRPNSTYFSTSVRLRKFISILLFNKKILSSKDELVLKNNYDHILSFLERFFYHFTNLLPEKLGDVQSYILGHEAVQNAIASYLHQAIFKLENSKLEWDFEWEEKLDSIAYIDWTLYNTTWEKYLITARANTSSEFSTIDISDEKNILKEINNLVL